MSDAVSAAGESKRGGISVMRNAALWVVPPWLIGQGGEVVDAAGHLWRIHDLRETTVVTMLFTMFFTATLAALRLARQ